MSKSEGGGVANLDAVLESLSIQSLKGTKTITVNVGYKAPYAVFVHEDIEAKHPLGGQAKYLEQPSRQYAREMSAIVERSVKAKNGLGEGLKRAGDFLLAKSQPLVPVETGELKASGYVEVVTSQ